MNLVDVLHADTYRCCAQEHNERFELVETHQDATLRQVFIQGVPKDTLLLKMDAYTISNLLNESLAGWLLKKCDYAMVDVEHKRIILIEIKSKKHMDQNLNSDVKNKMRGSQRMMEYLIDMIGTYHWCPLNNQHTYTYIYTVIADIPSPSLKVKTGYENSIFRLIRCRNTGMLYYDEFV